MLLIELIEGMEEFLLGGFLAGDELDIVDEEQVRFPIFVAEFDVLTALDGGNQFVGKLVTLDVDNLGIRLLLTDAVGNGIQQMGLTHAGRAVDKQRVVHITGMVADGDGSRMGKAVGRAHHEIIKIKLGIKIHSGQTSTAVAMGVQLFVTENQQLGIGIEKLLQSLMDVVGTALANNIPAEIRGRIENQMLTGQLHHFCIVKPGGDGHSAQLLLHVTKDFRPNIGG